MKIQMRTNIAGPDISASADDVIDVPDARAVELLAGGYAVPAGPLPPSIATQVDAARKAALPEPDEKKGK